MSAYQLLSQLSYNKLTTLVPLPFESLQHLRVLDVSNNRISADPTAGEQRSEAHSAWAGPVGAGVCECCTGHHWAVRNDFLLCSSLMILRLSCGFICCAASVTVAVRKPPENYSASINSQGGWCNFGGENRWNFDNNNVDISIGIVSFLHDICNSTHHDSNLELITVASRKAGHRDSTRAITAGSCLTRGRAFQKRPSIGALSSSSAATTVLCSSAICSSSAATSSRSAAICSSSAAATVPYPGSVRGQVWRPGPQRRIAELSIPSGLSGAAAGASVTLRGEEVSHCEPTEIICAWFVLMC